MTAPKADATFDYVVIGAGSAGCAVAARLSEDAGATVLLVEAGGGDGSPLFRIPGGQVFVRDWRNYAWLYDILPDASRHARTETWRRGRILGGSSTINGVIWAWGLPQDFDGWAAQGLHDWSWSQVAPWFRKSENFRDGGGAARGNDGPIRVERFRSPHPFTPDVIAACGETGMAVVDDINAVDGPAIGPTQSNQHRGVRQSSSRAYLGPIRGRSNLSIWTRARTTRLLLDGGRAIGAEIVRDGAATRVLARREVIVCAGAIASPQLLMLSGIGPAAHLRSHGIDVMVDSPDVGANLHDHPELYVEYEVAAPTYSRGKRPAALLSSGLQYLFGRRGPATSPGTHALGYARSGASPGAGADLLLFCGPWGQLSEQDAFSRGHDVFSFSPSVAKPRSRGRVRLASGDPACPPSVEANLLGDPHDVAVLRAGIRLIDRIAGAAPLRRHIVSRLTLPAGLEDDERVDDFVRAHSRICYHACGTCRMGTDERSVVDEALRVRGVDRLRVVDASVMPEITSGNLNAPTIMIAEKAADLIRRRWA